MAEAAMAERSECVMFNKQSFVLEAVSTLYEVLGRMEARQSKKAHAGARCATSERKERAMTSQELDTHVEKELESLRIAFAGIVPGEQVTQIGRDCFETLRATATIYDFIPLLVYRRTREELLTCGPDQLHQSA